MSVVQTCQEAVGKQQQNYQKIIHQCILCRKSFSRTDAHEHMHSMLHHTELESVLGKAVFHECQACEVSGLHLYEYYAHVSTPLHKAKLQSLMAGNTKPRSLAKTVGHEALCYIEERNKKLKKEKKPEEKKKKKTKPVQKHAEKVPESTRRSGAEASDVVMMQKFKQANQSMQQTFQKGRSNVVVQNKENKVQSVQIPLHSREATAPSRSASPAGSSGQPAGRAWHCDQVREQFPQQRSQVRFSDNASVHNQRVNMDVEHSQTGRSVKRPHSTHEGSRIDMIDRHCGGATIFDRIHNERTGSSQPGQESSHGSSGPASANRSTGAAPVGDADVSAMLRQIRRTLGMREPCRADREATRWNSEASDRVADRSTTQQTGTATGQPSGAASTSEQYPQVTIRPPAPAIPKSISVKVSQEMTGCAGNATSTEHSKRRIRIAHEPRATHMRNQAARKLILNKLLYSTKNKLSWSEKYNKRKRERKFNLSRTTRLRIELTKPPPEQRSSTQPPDTDLPLSQGFHWESIPDTPSATHLTVPPPPPPPPRDTSDRDPRREVQSGSVMQEPGTADQGGSSHTVTAAPVKAELSAEHEKGGSIKANKKKLDMEDISDKETNGTKKRKTSNNGQDPMDQLLVVSLREDELSGSLQNVDISLVQARNVLQTAYAEVQRLLILRHQFTTEVSTLRVRRIEILQGMQEGYSGEPNITTASSAGAAAHSPLPSSGAFLASSSQPPSATTSASPISHPPLAPSTTSVKEEATDAWAGQFISSSTDAPLKQPGPLFPSELPPPLPLRPSHSAAPTTSAAATSTSVNTHLQREQKSREAPKGCVKGTKEDTWVILSDSEEETGGEICSGAAGKPLPERDQSSAVVPVSDGNDSGVSLKVMEPSNPVVISIDESDNEASPDIVSDVSTHPKARQQASSVELSSANTRTFQQKEVDRKIPVSLPVKTAKSPAVSDEHGEPSLGEFLSHAGPVHSMQVYEGLLYTCSGDNTSRAYSVTTRECTAVFEGHTDKVNSLLVSSLPNLPARLYTGSSDRTIRCYSVKSKKCLEQISLADRVLCLHIAWNILYAGLANGSVASYDLRTLKQLDVFECHGPRGVSCLGTVQEGARRVLLVGSYDSTISVRDAKSGLLLRSLEGHTKTVLCMKVVNDLVFSGSSDTSVHAHNIHTGELLRIYKGHGQAVTSIIILGKVMVTACLDQLVRVFELQSHDCLQVYGVPSDMVVCMTIQKSVIYTGCGDGSVQAVKLNLMKNHRCWWQNCSLIFGVAEHLVRHLVGCHTNPNLQMVKCRWRGCDESFSTQQSVQQRLPGHMRSHVHNDSEKP